MPNRYVINFKLSDKQDINVGSVVTYLDPNRLEVLKEFFTIKTDFFLVKDIVGNRIKISNGIDEIETTEDQIIKVIPFLEEINNFPKPSISNNHNKYLLDLIKWNNIEDLRKSYPIEDKILSIMFAGLIIEEGDFYLKSSYPKKHIWYACLIPEKISTQIG